MTKYPLNDALPPRFLAARWVIRGRLTTETALHLGGERTERADMLVLRDPRTRKPLLPGTTFAGALRGTLADRLLGYGKLEVAQDKNGVLRLRPEAKPIAALFGDALGDDEGLQSALIVFDAIGEIPTCQGIEFRDGVALAPAAGVAEDLKKFRYEVVPAGTTFPVRIDLLIPVPTKREQASSLDEKSLLEALATSLDAFTHGQIELGAKRSRGLGKVRASWEAKRFDLGSSEGWLEWILSSHEHPFAGSSVETCIRDALEAVAPEALKALHLFGDARQRIVIDLSLRIRHDILVRSPGADPGGPDVTHLHSGGKALLPGTSLAGAMRAQAVRIAKLVRDATNDADVWVDRLFGPRFEGQRPSNKMRAYASRLRISEARLEDSRPQRQTRIALDRFTQGVVDNALFEEQSEVGGRASMRLELRNANEGELGLVILVLKDLLGGWLPVGGTVSVGRGVLCGSANITWRYNLGTVQRTARIEPGKPPSGEAAAYIDEEIRAFHNAASVSETAPCIGTLSNVEGLS